MNIVRVVIVCSVLLLMLVVAGCSEEKKESELVIVGEYANDDTNVMAVVVPDDGLDSALQELEELEGE